GRQYQCTGQNPEQRHIAVHTRAKIDSRKPVQREEDHLHQRQSMIALLAPQITKRSSFEQIRILSRRRRNHEPVIEKRDVSTGRGNVNEAEQQRKGPDRPHKHGSRPVALGTRRPVDLSFGSHFAAPHWEASVWRTTSGECGPCAGCTPKSTRVVAAWP